ncbi:hypothetical protein RAB80_009767 [Fusarium oxysporum f. sp. vasinfectum]|nr:hypothetical protein RAB80_009767 [Fusarium oxysporum f. sp. vasinfectum]KAK2692298.1 hypothetical protein QWA68_008062 [Fusarium oxysporum]KAK2931218.1 hypothetical protein FoTM2_008728 [Fusarium oxysporum f. sp. vasinfectum]
MFILTFILGSICIKVQNYLGTPNTYDSVCIFNEWAPKLDDIEIDFQNVAQESNDKETSRALDAVYIPVDIATNLQQENQQLKQAISCEFDDQRLLQITTESEALPSHPENPSLWTRMTVPSKESRLVVRNYRLLDCLQKLQEPRKDIWAKVSGQFRQDLSKIIYSVCYASTQVEDLAREAKTFNKPMLRRLQKVSVATYVLCQESRSDAQGLNELVDQLGVQLSLVEAAINKANGLRNIFSKKQGVKQLWKYLMAKSVTTEEELDNCEAELTMIGRSAIDMLDGVFVLPKPASLLS